MLLKHSQVTPVRLISVAVKSKVRLVQLAAVFNQQTGLGKRLIKGQFKLTGLLLTPFWAFQNQV